MDNLCTQIDENNKNMCSSCQVLFDFRWYNICITIALTTNWMDHENPWISRFLFRRFIFYADFFYFTACYDQWVIATVMQLLHNTHNTLSKNYNFLSTGRLIKGNRCPIIQIVFSGENLKNWIFVWKGQKCFMINMRVY